jgi:hypothetical protein
MTIGAMPVNQLDALPILTQQQVAAPGELVIVAGQVVKYWNPTQLGWNGVSGNVADPDVTAVAPEVSMFSAFIDARGCNSFVLMMVNDPPVAPAGTQNWQLRLQYSGVGSVGLVAPRSGAAGRILFGAALGQLDFNITLFANGITTVLGWSNGQESTSSATGNRKTTALGVFRVWLNRATGHDSTWYGSMWGTT